MNVKHGRNAITRALRKIVETSQDEQLIFAACKLWAQVVGVDTDGRKRRRKPGKQDAEQPVVPVKIDAKLAAVLGEKI